MLSAPRIPERDQLIKAVDDIGDTIRANAERGEQLRQQAPESVEALEQAGLFRMVVPRELGGYEADPVTQHEVIDRLSYYDASTGWCGFIGAGSSAFAAANIPDGGLEEVQASLPNGRSWARFAGSPVPVGRATRVDGGYRVSGRWPWASGVHHCSWVFAGASILKDGEVEMTDLGIPNGRLMVMPTSDIEIEDSWHTAGLRGTGSAHFNAADVFVPEHRTIAFPFPQPFRGGKLFQLPVIGFFGPAFSGFPQGVGRRALDEIVERGRSKTRVGQSSSVAERPVFHHELGRARSQLLAAGALVREQLAILWDGLHDGAEASGVETHQRLASFTLNTDAATHAAEFAYRHGGGDALFTSSPLQRILRDMRAADQHMLVTEMNFENLGKAIVAETD